MYKDSRGADKRAAATSLRDRDGATNSYCGEAWEEAAHNKSARWEALSFGERDTMEYCHADTAGDGALRALLGQVGEERETDSEHRGWQYWEGRGAEAKDGVLPGSKPARARRLRPAIGASTRARKQIGHIFKNAEIIRPVPTPGSGCPVRRWSALASREKQSRAGRG